MGEQGFKCGSLSEGIHTLIIELNACMNKTFSIIVVEGGFGRVRCLFFLELLVLFMNVPRVALLRIFLAIGSQDITYGVVSVIHESCK